MGKFGKIVRKYRKRKGWTLHEFSKKIKKSDCYISEIENGIEFPSLLLIKVISGKLELGFKLLRKLAVADKQKALGEKIEKRYEE